MEVGGGGGGARKDVVKFHDPEVNEVRQTKRGEVGLKNLHMTDVAGR